MKGDAGGKSILEHYPGEIGVIRVRSEGVIRDIDTQDDYRNERPLALSGTHASNV